MQWERCSNEASLFIPKDFLMAERFHSKPLVQKIEKALLRNLQQYQCTKTVRLHRLRDLYTMASAHMLLKKQITASKRDLYYMGRGIFKTQSNADASLERVSRTLGTERSNLNILGAPRALIAGHLTFADENGLFVDVSAFDYNPILIPPRPERLRMLMTDARFVLV